MKLLINTAVKNWHSVQKKYMVQNIRNVFLSRKEYGMIISWEKITSQSMTIVTIITTKLKIIISIKGWVFMFACTSTKVFDLSIPSKVFLKFVFLYDTVICISYTVRRGL
jgi:hypothetical protein